MLGKRAAMAHTGGMRDETSEGWRQVEHTADLAVEMWAPDDAGLLRVALRAVVALLTDGADPPAAAAWRAVSIDGLDPEDRLVQWMNEVIFQATVEGFVPTEARVTLAGDGGLSGTLGGLEGARGRLTGEIKAATYHDLRIARGPSGLHTVVVLDV